MLTVLNHIVVIKIIKIIHNINGWFFMNKTSDVLEKNIVKRNNNITNQFGFDLGINEKNSLPKKTNLKEFILNDMIVIKKR